MPRGVPHCSSQTDDKPGPKRVVFPNPLLTRYILLTTSWNKRLTRQLSTLTDIRIVKQIQNQKRKNNEESYISCDHRTTSNEPAVRRQTAPSIRNAGGRESAWDVPSKQENWMKPSAPPSNRSTRDRLHQWLRPSLSKRMGKSWWAV